MNMNRRSFFGLFPAIAGVGAASQLIPNAVATTVFDTAAKNNVVEDSFKVDLDKFTARVLPWNGLKHNDVALHIGTGGDVFWGLPRGIEVVIPERLIALPNLWYFAFTAQTVDSNGNPGTRDEGGKEMEIGQFDKAGRRVFDRVFDWPFNSPGSDADRVVFRIHAINRMRGKPFVDGDTDFGVSYPLPVWDGKRNKVVKFGQHPDPDNQRYPRNAALDYINARRG